MDLANFEEMPTVLIESGFRFFFYSSEGNEPVHIHVTKGDAEGKIWLEPHFQPAYMHGFTPAEGKKVITVAEKNKMYFKKRWHEHFNQ
ncbi:MAG: DUF4160 domain-containing protein [Anditalea sp.]